MWPSLRTILFAGEVFPTKHLRSLMRLLPHVEFFNLFGPTETNACTFYKVPKLSDDFTDSIPIGRPIADVGVIVTTADGRVAERGEVGELWVRGSTVMRGYWGDPERTERALVSNPVAPRSGERVYRTGDLVREDEHGDLHFLGRVDNQIKSRGYRIELGEVEAALYAHPAVIECAVTAIPDEMVTNRIKAFVVVGEPVEAAALASFCAHRIPRYMIPEEFEVRPRLPKTSTGKVDRQTLIGGSASRST